MSSAKPDTKQYEPAVTSVNLILGGGSSAERIGELYKLSEILVANNQLTSHQHHVLTVLIREKSKKITAAIDTYAAADQIEQLRNALVAAVCDRLESAWNQLFTLCSTADAKRISKTEKSNLGISAKPALTYGEVTIASLAAVLYSPLIRLKAGGNFYDLGSGSGRGVFAAALLHNFDRCTGIEIISGLHTAASAVLDRWNISDAPNVITYQTANNNSSASAPANANANANANGSGSTAAAANDRKAAPAGSYSGSGSGGGGGGGRPVISFQRASFLDVDWSDGDVIFINSTCFDETLLSDIARLGLALKDGTYIITLTKRLKSAAYRLLDSSQQLMSWGYATVHLQQKISPTAIAMTDSSNAAPQSLPPPPASSQPPPHPNTNTSTASAAAMQH